MGSEALYWELAAAASRGDIARVQALSNDSLHPALGLAFTGGAEFVVGDFERAVITTERARISSADAGALVQLFALSFRVLASAGVAWEDPTTDDGFPELWGRRGALTAIDHRILPVARFAMVEAAFATGRFEQAAEVLGPVDDVLQVGAGIRPFPALLLQPARLMMFRGDAAAARPHLDAALRCAEDQGDDIWTRCVKAATVFAAVQCGETAGLDEADRELFDLSIAPSGYLDAAAFAFLAYARAAVGKLSKAEEILRVAGGPRFGYLQVADRALCCDILIAAALERGDVAEAELIVAELLPLTAHPGAHVVVEQAFARIDAAGGRMIEAAERAAVAAARAELAGRYRDAANVRMVRARALAALGQSEQAVQEYLSTLAGSGDHGVERQALRQLRLLGRRPRPALGSGWTALSPREREVAALVAGGQSNRVIAATLFVSERTVEGHVSRILSALGVTSRSGIPARMFGHLDAASPPAQQLTPRQQLTAELVATGLGNIEIAGRLGVSVKTVEKNITEILRRWQLTSRTGIARMIIDAPVFSDL